MSASSTIKRTPVQTRGQQHSAATPRFAALLVALSLSALARSQSTEEPTEAAAPDQATAAAFQNFLARNPGEWHVDWNAATGTPCAVYGSGLRVLEWREDSLGEARRHANQLLQDQHELLGLGSSEFREDIGARMGRCWAFVYRQYFHSIPVIGGRTDVRIHDTGCVSMFGSSAWPIPATFDTIPRIDETGAQRIVFSKLGIEAARDVSVEKQGRPRLVIWGDGAAERRAACFLAWEIPVDLTVSGSAGTIGRYYVDARTGILLQFVSDKHDCNAGVAPPNVSPTLPPPSDASRATRITPTTVTIMGWTRTGISAASPLVNIPLSNLKVTVPGVGVLTTDSNGQITVNLPAPVTLALGYVSGVPFVANFPTTHGTVFSPLNFGIATTVTITPGGNHTIQLLYASADPMLAAHTTAMYWVNRINIWTRSVLGNSTQMSLLDSIVARVNMSGSCNAYYSNNSINFYPQSSTCNNSAFSGVIAHEWGHALDDAYGGISQTEGLSEAWGDIVSMYILDTPLVGANFYTNGSAVRTGLNNTQYQTQTEVHAAGEVFMGFAWQLRDRLASTIGSRATAISLTNNIVLGSIVADATTQAAAVREVFIADDNDASLSNGTPHYLDIIWACRQHALPFPHFHNDEYTAATSLVVGRNGPFTTAFAGDSSQSMSCIASHSDVWFVYRAPSDGQLAVSTCGLSNWDTTLQVFSNTGSLVSVGCNDNACGVQSSVSVPVTAGNYYVRVGGQGSARGSFSLDVAFTPVSIVSFGTGCGATSRSFYEAFANAAAFDLIGTSMRLTLTGDHYIVSPGGAFVPPGSGSIDLALGLDSEMVVPLIGSLTYPGGSTSVLAICSNGYVATAPGNILPNEPVAQRWLSAAGTRWGCWHRMNPSQAGSGHVRFEQSSNVAIVTWYGVMDRTGQPTGVNTWQLQFDLSSGSVTLAILGVAASTHAFVVGFGASGSFDLGSSDISYLLPTTFSTQRENLSALALTGTLPRLGTVLTLSAAPCAQTATFGVQALSLTRTWPGADLSSMGMPGCSLLANLDLLLTTSISDGVSGIGIQIPTDTNLIGLLAYSQSFVPSPGANLMGVAASNGVALLLGP